MKQKLLIILLLGMAFFSNAFAQGKKITGKVISAEDGQTLPGVSVKVQGTTKGVLTDGDGNFSITVDQSNYLVFSYVGFNEQSVKVPAVGSFINVKMVSSNRLLTEVVVTDGYTTQSKKYRTGSSTIVSGAQNENKPFSTPMQALQGQVPGLNVTTNSGQPGANIQVRLRGVNSIAGGNNPLYVIDGMIINAGDLSRLTTTMNVLAGINADDIESVTVLKDASETSLYGSRGANGVVIITTKRGKAGKTDVRIDAEGGATSVLPLPSVGMPLTASQFRELFIEGDTNSGASAAELADDLQSYGLNGRSNNWYDLVTRRGTQQQYNVSINGGTDATRIFASAGYFTQEATVIASKLRRFTGQLNIDHNISKRISLSSNINFSNVNQYTPSNGGTFANPVGSIWFLTPYQLAYNDDGSLNSSSSGNNNFNSQYNPLYIAQHDKNYASQSRILTGLTLKWNITDNLRFTSFASIDYNVLEEQAFYNPIQGDGAPNGIGYDDYTRYFNWLTRNQFEYRGDIISDMHFNVVAGYEAQRSQGYLISAQGTGFPATQPLLISSANASTPVKGSGTFSNYAFDSFYSIGGINYKGRYSLTATFRRDGSSVFGSGVRYGNFYSFGGAWNIDQERFFNIQHTLSSAKLRASYGTVGNAQGISNYQARATAGYGANYAGKNGQNYNTVGNPDLTWESQKKLDVGADLGFLHDRLNFTVDWYRNNIDNLLLTAQLSRTTGFSSITQNIGGMMNRGVEFAVLGVPIKSKDFVWNTSFNISFNHNTITSLVGHAPIASAPFQYREGMDINTYFVRLYAGVDPANGNALWYTDATRTATTTNYSAAQRVNMYQADPKYFGGFSNTFTYKGFSLTADLYYNFGNMVSDAQWGYYLNDGTFPEGNKYQYIYLNRWTHPGQVTDVPKYSFAGVNAGSSSSFSTRSIYYGDYLRLKNLSLGYDFKSISYLKKFGISRLYLYGRATNLWTKTYDKRLPFDPEQGVAGYNNLEVLQGRTFTIGLNVGL